jgi:hypothetical protein
MQQADPALLDWAAHRVDVVIEATGRFRTRKRATTHLTAGACKVVLTSPGTRHRRHHRDGINQDVYDAAPHHIVSNASCTTNCATPMALVLDQAFGIEEGLLTTIHSYTSDQNLLDGPHKDLRRARAAAVNIIPTATGAARAIGVVLPRLAGRLDGIAVRVPVVDGSLVDFTVRLTGRPMTAVVSLSGRTAHLADARPSPSLLATLPVGSAAPQPPSGSPQPRPAMPPRERPLTSSPRSGPTDSRIRARARLTITAVGGAATHFYEARPRSACNACCTHSARSPRRASVPHHA